MPSVCKYTIYSVVAVSLSDYGFLYTEIHLVCFCEVWFLTIKFTGREVVCHHFDLRKIFILFRRASEYTQLSSAIYS